MLQNWISAFIRIDPLRHRSVRSSDHPIRPRQHIRHDWLLCVGWCFALELADLPTILLICFALEGRYKHRTGVCNVVESLKSMLRIPLATLPPCPHSSRAKGDCKTSQRSQIVDTLTWLFPIAA